MTNFIIHHLGKAGEVFLGLPMARLLKRYDPQSTITWVVLDLYRDSIGLYPFVDRIDVIPTYSCKTLDDVNSHINKHIKYFFNYGRLMKDKYGVHINAYYDYIVCRKRGTMLGLSRLPFYTQFFYNAVYLCPGADKVDSWTPPEWYPTEQAMRDGEEFEKQYGGGSVVIFSPYVADQSCKEDNQSNFDMQLIYNELRKWNLPVICTGTKWDTKDFPEWAFDGYSPKLSLGGLFYLIKNRAALVVSPNSGIGFAAHWLGAPTLMIDNRTGWLQQIQFWKSKLAHFEDHAFPGERRWPPFMKENFYPQHLLPVPFEQIEWSTTGFMEAVGKIKSMQHDKKSKQP